MRQAQPDDLCSYRMRRRALIGVGWQLVTAGDVDLPNSHEGWCRSTDQTADTWYNGHSVSKSIRVLDELKLQPRTTEIYMSNLETADKQSPLEQVNTDQ